GRGLPQGPKAPAAADDRDRRCHRHWTVPWGRRTTAQRRTGPVLELRVLRHLRLPDPAGAGRARASPALVGVLRVVCARIPRREGGVRRRLDVLAELGVHGHRRLQRDRHLLPLLVGVRERPAVADRPGRVGGRYQIQGQLTGFSVIANNGGLFPAGLFPLVIVMSGVVFAYAAVELVGT